MPKPWQSRQEMLVDLALESALQPVEKIKMIRPPFPVALFPQTRGEMHMVPGINDVLNIDRSVQTNRSWLSGLPVMQQQFSEGEFSAGGRYAMNSIE